MEQREAVATVVEIDAIRRADRLRLASLPYPLAAFAAVNLGGVVAVALLGRGHLAPYGIVAFTLAVAASARSLARRASPDGAQLSIVPWVLTAIALFLSASSTSRLGFALDLDLLTVCGPFMVEALGFWLLGRWAGSDALQAMATVMLGASALIGALVGGDLAVGLQFAAFGAALCVAALRARTTGAVA